MGAFYQPPTISGTVGKRMVVLYGGNSQAGTGLTDLWYFDVGKLKQQSSFATN